MHDTFQRAVTVLLAAAVVGAGAAGVAAAAADGSIEASPAAAGETATHAMTATVGNESTGSWNGFSVDYGSSGADAAAVGAGDVLTVGVDRGDDDAGTAVDVNASTDLGDVKASNDGTTLTVKLGGSVDLDAGDEVVVVVADVRNPESAGEYALPLDVNPQSSGGEASAVLHVDAREGSTTDDATTEQSDDVTTEQSDDATTEPADDGSGGSTPGFGVGVAVVGAVGAALLALRE